jgi:hypothetical protein
LVCLTEIVQGWLTATEVRIRPPPELKWKAGTRRMLPDEFDAAADRTEAV